MQLQYSPAPVDFGCWEEGLKRSYQEVGGLCKIWFKYREPSIVFSGPILDSPKGALQWCDCSDKWRGCVWVIVPFSSFQMEMLLLRSDKAKYSRLK